MTLLLAGMILLRLDLNLYADCCLSIPLVMSFLLIYPYGPYIGFPSKAQPIRGECPCPSSLGLNNTGSCVYPKVVLDILSIGPVNPGLSYKNPLPWSNFQVSSDVPHLLFSISTGLLTS